MMERSELLRVVQDLVTDEVVVPVMSAIKGWARIPEHFFWCTAMGYGSSVALGLALAQPERKVIVLDGDGSLLMNLGTLVTIAEKAPKNFYHFVLENGVYAVTGGQPIPGNNKISFSGMAKEAGYASAFEFDDLEDFASRAEEVMGAEGPVFICVKTTPEIQNEPMGLRAPSGVKPTKAAIQDLKKDLGFQG